jgi:hypothetical protein
MDHTDSLPVLVVGTADRLALAGNKREAIRWRMQNLLTGYDGQVGLEEGFLETRVALAVCLNSGRRAA